MHGIGRGEQRFAHTALADRVEWDNYYIENWSLWLDIRLIIKTVPALLNRSRPT